MMKNIIALILLCGMAMGQQAPPTAPAAALPDISGMYSFLHDGEFVEVDVDAGNVSGFISRYGDKESDRGAFLDQMFTKATFDGKNLSFTTREVHGVTYSFQGKVLRGDAKVPLGGEGYWVLKGTLTETTMEPPKKTSSRERAVEFKSFPSDAQWGGEKRD